MSIEWLEETVRKSLMKARMIGIDKDGLEEILHGVPKDKLKEVLSTEYGIKNPNSISWDTENVIITGNFEETNIDANGAYVTGSVQVEFDTDNKCRVLNTDIRLKGSSVVRVNDKTYTVTYEEVDKQEMYGKLSDTLSETMNILKAAREEIEYNGVRSESIEVKKIIVLSNGVRISETISDRRAKAKVTNFGLPYGMGADSLAKKIFGDASSANSSKKSGTSKRYKKNRKQSNKDKIADMIKKYNQQGVKIGMRSNEKFDSRHN